MADKPEPPVTDALMALLAGAAPLFERAKASGMFRPQAAAASSSSSASLSSDDFAAQKSALQEIVVAQAMKIVALEAEIAKLKVAGGQG